MVLVTAIVLYETQIGKGTLINQFPMQLGQLLLYCSLTRQKLKGD